MKVKAVYVYEAPDGTYTEEEGRLVQHIFYAGDLDKVFDEISNDFDGLETFLEKRDEMKARLRHGLDWVFDDSSAGQFVRIQRWFDDTAKIEVSINLNDYR